MTDPFYLCTISRMQQLKTNKVKRALKAGEVCFGTMVTSIRSPQVAQILAAAGFDYFVLDMEHNYFGMENLADIMSIARAEEIVPLVRVPDTLYHLMARTLDCGAMGLVCPRVETREQVEVIIKSTKYQPLGQRGASISNIHTACRSMDHLDYMQWANEETMIVIQIESKHAVDHIEELVSVEGVDATWIGPFDLAQTMGLVGKWDDPELIRCYEKVIDACNRHSVAPGIHLRDSGRLAYWVSRGMRLATYSSDSGMLIEAGRNLLRALRQSDI
jgi:2-keto-3-deoxy-L-rhamnonate aldolase RhmA